MPRRTCHIEEQKTAEGVMNARREPWQLIDEEAIWIPYDDFPTTIRLGDTDPPQGIITAEISRYG